MQLKTAMMIVLLVATVNTVHANQLYDNITANDYRTLRPVDDINIPIVNSYYYYVYIAELNGTNSRFLGNFSRNDVIPYPDNVTVRIDVPAPLSTNANTVADTGKTYVVIVLIIALTFIIALTLIAWIVKHIWR